ncbi:Arm DNA-binding domain-containing protein [Nioella sp.]|uniref:Arm DNA-binding domain-containing protein n=1 Tax=Nioella sp. TaxID=1912091 RepID=UPI003A8A7F89
MALTDLKIKKAKVKEKPYKMYNSLGLFVLVNPNGTKLWRQKYQLGGKERTIAHGPYPVVSLRDARQKRDAIRDQLAAGTDPAVQKRLDQIEAETQARTTFLLVAEEYLQIAHDRELADARECPELCVSGPVHAVSDTQASKRSPNIMANWLRAANHSLTFRPSFSKLRMAR